MKQHHLKAWPEYFKAVTHPNIKQRKMVELRFDDRGYEVGDVLVLKEWDPEKQAYTGQQTTRRVTHITRGEPWLRPGYVALSICENTNRPWRVGG